MTEVFDIGVLFIDLPLVYLQKKLLEWFVFSYYILENQTEHMPLLFKWKSYFIPSKCAIINTRTRALFSLQGKHLFIYFFPAWQVRISVRFALHKYCIHVLVFMLHKMESLIHHDFPP